MFAVVGTSNVGGFVCAYEASRSVLVISSESQALVMSPFNATELLPSDASVEVGSVYFHGYIFLHENELDPVAPHHISYIGHLPLTSTNRALYRVITVR